MRSATKRKAGKDPAYLSYIRSLPCCVCVALGASQTSLTESAHVGPRGLSQKSSDRETLPLCCSHHREGQFCQHALGRFFFQHYDLDREFLLKMYQSNYDGHECGVLSARDAVIA